jgi:RNA methyltransferase, TrmH family
MTRREVASQRMARCWLASGRCGRLGKPCASGRCLARTVRRLHDRRWRDKLGLFVAEGEDLVEAAAAAGVEPVELLMAGETVEPELLGEVSTLGHPPRVIGVFRRGDLPVGAAGEVGLALWRIGDPGNVGTLLRAADTLGPAFVGLSEGCADPTGPKALRASAGSVFRVRTCAFEESPRPWVALVPRGGRPLWELDMTGRTTFVLGAERAGLPDEVLAHCDERVTIPQSDAAESLNVAMAGTIALYERQRSRD